MRIKIDITKTVEQNAGLYYDKAKKIKKKIEGAKIALEKTKEKLARVKEEARTEQSEIKKKAETKKEWYEKFRWFFSSDGFLCIGGRDSTSNEIVIKKHMEQKDIVFHTDMPGSPFFVIKTNGNTPGEDTIREAAEATLCYSKAWKAGIGAGQVFYVNPEQVSKEAMAGEFIAKGAFMIYGKKNYIKPADIKLAIASVEGKIIAGPVSAIKKQVSNYITVVQGDEKTSDTAKKIKKALKAELDDIIRVLPAGGCKIAK